MTLSNSGDKDYQVLNDKSFMKAKFVMMAIFAITVMLTVMLLIAKQQPDSRILAPDFEVMTFDGELLKLSDLQGDVVIVNFWASWCVPCRIEAPEFQAAWEYYQERGDVHFVGLAYRDFVQESQAFITEQGITYTNAPDLGHLITDSYGVNAIPATFIINRDGQIETFLLARLSMETLITHIDPLLQ